MKTTFKINTNSNCNFFDCKLLEHAVNRYKRDFIDTGKSIGAVDPYKFNCDVVNLSDVSHVVKSINVDTKGILSGEIELLDTPKGNVMKQIIERGLTPEYSMSYRIKDNNVTEIVQISIVGYK